MNVRLILLACLAYLSMSLADIFRYQICPGSSDKKPLTIIRENPVRIRYTLLRGVEAGFPDLSDKFYLAKAQRVKISYTITLWSMLTCFLRTTVVIDGKQQRELNYITNDTQERTHSVSYDVWMEEGFHYLYVEYFTNGNIVNMPANSQGNWFYSLLQI